MHNCQTSSEHNDSTTWKPMMEILNCLLKNKNQPKQMVLHMQRYNKYTICKWVSPLYIMNFQMYNSCLLGRGTCLIPFLPLVNKLFPNKPKMSYFDPMCNRWFNQEVQKSIPYENHGNNPKCFWLVEIHFLINYVYVHRYMALMLLQLH
jgi:hypothetical protein